MLATAATITTTARLLTPLINDIYKGAKAVGARGFLRWDATTFPKKLAKRLRVIEEVRTLWEPEKEVSLLDFYYPSKVAIDGNVVALQRLSELGPGNFVVEGIVGQGKSILLRHMAMQEILSNDARALPVFIELRTLTKTFGLTEAVTAHLSSFDIDLDDASLAYLCRSGRLSYLLDGFDELEEALIKPTLHELEALTTKYPELQIIITCRPRHEIQKSTAFKIVRIAPLSTSDYSPFLLKLGLEAIKVSQIKDAIRKSPSNVSELITTPLMLTLVVMVYESEREIPETLPEFFERLFRVVFTRHDRLKAAFTRKHHSGLSERRLQALFEAFCFMVLQNGFTRSLTPDQFEAAFDQAVEYSENCECDADDFRQDLTKVACLMLEEGLDVTTFLHKSILEYYAAAFIKHSMDEVATLFYTSVRLQSRPWWEVLSFLEEIDPYRFARDFAVPEIRDVQEGFLGPLESRDDTILIVQLQNVHPGLGVSLGSSTEHSDEMTPKSFGPFRSGDRMAMRLLDDLLIHALTSVAPGKLQRSQVLELIRTERVVPSDLTVYDLSLAMLMKAWGSKDIWQAIDIFSARLVKQLAEAQTIIDGQQRRKLIFAKKS